MLHAYQKNAHHLFFNVTFGVTSYQVNIHENGNSNSFSNALDDFGGSQNMEYNQNSYITLKTA